MRGWFGIDVIGLVAISHSPLISPVSMAGKMSVCVRPRLRGKKRSSMPQKSATCLRSDSFSSSAVTRQPGARRPFARAHGIALAGDRQARAARNADVAGDEVEVVDVHDAVGAVRGLVDAHRPDAHRGRRLRIDARDLADAVLVDAAHMLRRLRVVFGGHRAQRFDAVGVPRDVVLVFQPFLEDHVQHRVDSTVSVPGVIGRWMSANCASIVTRGSTTISGNLRFSSASFSRQ